MWKILSTEVILVVTVIFCDIVFNCFARELPIAAQPLPPVNQSNYVAHFPSINDFTGSSFVSSALSSSKKYAAPPAYLEDTQTHTQREIHNITDIVPFLVDNVIRPIIKHVLVNQNVYTYLKGSPSSTESTDKAVTTLSNSNNDPPTTTASSSKIVGKGESTTDQDGNSVRNLLEEKVGDVTVRPGKTKYRVRPRERPSTSTTRASYITDEDDEDDSGVFNKIKLL